MSPASRLDPRRLVQHVATRHGLSDDSRPANAAAATERLLALHATDPATIHLSVHARCGGGDVRTTAAGVTAALESSRVLARWLGMRRTLHVVATDLVPTVLSIYRHRLLPTSKRNLGRMLSAADVCPEDDAETMLDRIRSQLLDALADGPATSTELAEAVPALRASYVYKPEKPYGGRIGLGSHLLGHFGVTGDLVRAHTQGGWRSGRCSWARTDRWLGTVEAPSDPHDAARHLVRRYLEAFGPVSFDDIAWWTGLPKGWIRRGLADLEDLVAVEVGDWPAEQLVLTEQLEPLQAAAPAEAESRAFLLPALDPTIMGYQWRDRFLDPRFTSQLFDRNGNAGPTVWWRGRVIGAWAHHKRSGEVVWKLLEAPEAESAVAEAAANLRAALGEDRVAPRFPAPLQKTLS